MEADIMYMQTQIKRCGSVNSLISDVNFSGLTSLSVLRIKTHIHSTDGASVTYRRPKLLMNQKDSVKIPILWLSLHLTYSIRVDFSYYLVFLTTRRKKVNVSNFNLKN